jgi:exodeoxyribonuclease V alpha subunit
LELGAECEDDEEDEVWSERFAGSCGELRFNVQQQGAMLAIYNKPGVVVTGGPGTGKTTVIAAANKLLWAQGTTVFNVAFSGKAVKVLRDRLRPEAHCYTLHRFLRVIIHEETALDFHGSVIVCDEASMVDIVLFDELLRHVDATQSRLVLVGDPDQLPPVGLGTPFNDLVSGINAGHIMFPQWKLTETNRYAADMAAFVNGIQHGVWNPPATVTCIEMPALPGHRARGEHRDNNTAGYSCWDDSLQDIMGIIKELFDEHPELRDLSKTMFLAPQHEYVCGTRSLSTALQKTLNPDGQIMAACSANYGRKKGSLMKEDDAIVRTVNSYGATKEDDDHYNGDDAVVKRSTRANKYIVKYTDGTTEELGAHQLRDDFELGYIRTIHKSQGGETDNIVLVGPLSCHAMWRMPGARKLLTVALSRAKKAVWVLGHGAAIVECLKSRDDVMVGRMFQGELAKDTRTATRV